MNVSESRQRFLYAAAPKIRNMTYWGQWASWNPKGSGHHPTGNLQRTKIVISPSTAAKFRIPGLRGFERDSLELKPGCISRSLNTGPMSRGGYGPFSSSHEPIWLLVIYAPLQDWSTESKRIEFISVMSSDGIFSNLIIQRCHPHAKLLPDNWYRRILSGRLHHHPLQMISLPEAGALQSW